ncbi:hypothetical protein IMZ48_13140 [Candidatus Bathyarchaeota archaeon]|nr:hypothetical protein [Candidatus Bathyarchaeota archaeon]
MRYTIVPRSRYIVVPQSQGHGITLCAVQRSYNPTDPLAPSNLTLDSRPHLAFEYRHVSSISYIDGDAGYLPRAGNPQLRFLPWRWTGEEPVPCLGNPIVAVGKPVAALEVDRNMSASSV